MAETYQYLWLVSLNILIFLVSIDAFKTKTIYGIYRFLGFESIALLVFLNSPVWFDDPFSSLQLLSWFFLLCSIALAIIGSHLLRNIGKAQERGIEGTQVLVEIGIYQYIRHPLYTSLICFVIGAFLKDISILGVIFAGVGINSLFLTAIEEEKFNTRRFGQRYIEYMNRTKRFIPYIF